MNKLIFGTLLSCFIGLNNWAKEHAPIRLCQAIHCLIAKDFISSSEATKHSFGYLLDEESYPGDKVIYLVEFTSPSRSGGSVYVLFFTEKDGRQIFHIQNNAKFRLDKNEPSGVIFNDPPLGGTWTQQHIASAIMRIEKLPRFKISPKELTSADSLINCESYTDK